MRPSITAWRRGRPITECCRRRSATPIAPASTTWSGKPVRRALPVIAVRLLAAGTIVREAVVRHGTFLIGRGPENDLVIADPSVSRQHARVRIDENGTAWMEDAGSRHGVRVGGAPVERVAVPPGTSLRCELGAVQVELAALSLD